MPSNTDTGLFIVLDPDEAEFQNRKKFTLVSSLIKSLMFLFNVLRGIVHLNVNVNCIVLDLEEGGPGPMLLCVSFHPPINLS